MPKGRVGGVGAGKKVRVGAARGRAPSVLDFPAEPLPAAPLEAGRPSSPFKLCPETPGTAAPGVFGK